MNFHDIIIACYHCRCLCHQYYIIVSQSERCVLYTVDLEEEICGGGNLRGVFRRGRGGADHVLDLQKDPPWRLQTQQAG